MKNKIKAPNIVIVGILTLITIVFWIVFSIIRAVQTPQKVEVPADILKPLDPTLDTQSINDIEQRIFYTSDQIGQTAITIPSPSPSASPEATATASPSPSPSSSPTATQSGTTNNSTGSATTQ
jgi:hypothetical protein